MVSLAALSCFRASAFAAFLPSFFFANVGLLSLSICAEQRGINSGPDYDMRWQSGSSHAFVVARGAPAGQARIESSSRREAGAGESRRLRISSRQQCGCRV
ncbi:hypothetical protein, partial [Accumulibacter sp.]|uniref:hypothetical protein n=1 Tax=Accumulibacter sp. TaxID=2053492 RepID=UPI0025F68C7A